MMKCGYCDKEFANKSNLTRHELTSKKCNKNNTPKEPEKIQCEFCNKELCSKYSLNRHIAICRHAKKRENDIQNIVSKLQDEVTDLRSDKNNVSMIKDNILSLNSIPIISRREDGYINLTALCKAGKKEFKEWKRNKKTQDFLKIFQSTAGIPAVDLLKFGSNGTGERHTWGQPQVAVNVAQWISPEFDVRVSKWIYELALTGKVELKNEKTNVELDNIYEEKRLSLDIQPYLVKDIVYFFEFIPNEKDLVAPELLKDENIHFFEFGVTSNIQQRQISYGSGHRLDKGFIYKTGYLASLGESYVKKIVSDMNLKLGYKNKIECMRCTYEELEKIYELMDKHSSFVKEDPMYEVINSDVDLQRMELELKYKLENTKLEMKAKQENDKIEMQTKQFELKAKQENDKMQIQAKQQNDKRHDIINLFKENILTFDQFQKCLSVL